LLPGLQWRSDTEAPTFAQSIPRAFVKRVKKSISALSCVDVMVRQPAEGLPAQGFRVLVPGSSPGEAANKVVKLKVALVLFKHVLIRQGSEGGLCIRHGRPPERCRCTDRDAGTRVLAQHPEESLIRLAQRRVGQPERCRDLRVADQ
jgi:hypothetical protein